MKVVRILISDKNNLNSDFIISSFAPNCCLLVCLALRELITWFLIWNYSQKDFFAIYLSLRSCWIYHEWFLIEVYFFGWQLTFKNWYAIKLRSSRLQMFFKTDVLKISQYSQENTCVGASRSATLLKKDSNTGVFLWKLQNFKKSFFIEHLRWCFW